MADDRRTERRTLRDGDIASADARGRRAALRGALALAVGALLPHAASAQAPAPTSPASPAPVTPQAPELENDSDAGPSRQATGFTDRDRGKQADPPGNGRGTEPSPVPTTDFDSGPGADRAGRGRGGRGLGSDNDRGARADPVGEGRRKPTKRR